MKEGRLLPDELCQDHPNHLSTAPSKHEVFHSAMIRRDPVIEKITKIFQFTEASEVVVEGG